MNLRKVLDFPLNQYYQSLYTKKGISLHHTCGSTAEGAISWWKQKDDRVGTAYIIDKDGTVHEVFNSNHWAYQFGFKNLVNRNEIEHSFIGIEIVNEGGLYKRNGKYYTDWNSEYKGEVKEQAWRDYKFWATYSDAQYAACAELIKMLSAKHKIEIKLNESIDFDLRVLKTHTVINHANVRMDKTDLSPAFDFGKLKTQLALY